MQSCTVRDSEAIRLAQASDWKALQRLLERHPHVAQEPGDHGMLPLHWACTVSRVPLSLIAKLLQAYPDSVRAKNSGALLPLHIAIRARVQASCLRKLVRAYPEAISERTPDNVSALELAESIGLDNDRMKVLYRVYDRRRTLELQQHPMLNTSEAADESDSKYMQEEGEASGINNLLEKEMLDYLDPMLPECDGGNGFFHIGDDDEVDGLGPDNSISIMSAQSLSDLEGLESPHGHLVSPSSTSSCSQDEGVETSSQSSFGSPFSRTSPLRLTGNHRQSRDLILQPSQLSRSTSSHVPLQTHQFANERELRSMVSTTSATMTNVMTTDDTAKRGFSRHSSLPVTLKPDILDPSSLLEVDKDHDEVEIESSRDSSSTMGGLTTYQRGQLFQGQETLPLTRYSVSRDGSQMSLPLVSTRLPRRASLEAPVFGSIDPPPEWKHDGECSICRATFGMFKHRHHCRNCGKSICSQHSADKKIAIEAKGFTTPQRVCVTCYAMITHTRALRHDFEVEEMSRQDSTLNVNEFPPFGASQTHLNDRHLSVVAAFPSAIVSGLSRSNTGFTSTRGPMDAAESPTRSPRYHRKASSIKSSVVSAGEATSGVRERATSKVGSGPTSPVHELRCLLASQQKQIEQLAQSNMQMQQQLLEQEELKAETMLIITQLMTRVSVLELQKDRHFQNKRRSAETGESDDDDEDYPQDDRRPFEH
ncbi:hypothetical protein CCR75_006033 [Bremia lactucae]|uniref:FYVE-type domain-containing protein n=1 Tax=Bremia lactucae TaxID=4779 RepID=A0A976FM42_BRELC|nr:hypothetical protein CCR75_006033 [Bremia lactucae]